MVGFPWIWLHLGLRHQQNSATYYTVEEAKDFVRGDESVIVIENNGEARAHPDYHIKRPHLAGSPEGLGGENVILTYCAMTHLGHGYKPEIKGEKLDLEVIAQHGNNLIMKDLNTGEPIQQMYGTRECDGRYGEGFRYGELTRMGRGVVGAVSAAGLSAGMGAFMGLVALPPTRWLLTRFVLPAPGEGPSRQTIEKGYFKILLSGRRSGEEVGRVVVTGRRDPGYGATACMLAESALCLALDPLSSPGGILTPAAAMGAPLRARLDATDVQFAFASADSA